jgi:membrane protease YdiL (CAAX protease family)
MHRVSGRAIAGLIIAIATADYVVNALASDAVEIPVKVGIVAGLVLWARRAVGLSWDEIGFGRDDLARSVRIGAVAVLCIAAVVTILVAVPATRSFFEDGDVADDSTTRRVLMPLLVIPLGTAIFEEILFRGVVLGVFLRATTQFAAVVASSVLFGCWHLPSALHDARGESMGGALGVVVGTIAVTTVAGLLFAALRLSSRGLAAPVLAHTATNSLAYVGAVIALAA